jgi:hypothetical protein
MGIQTTGSGKFHKIIEAMNIRQTKRKKAEYEFDFREL